MVENVEEITSVRVPEDGEEEVVRNQFASRGAGTVASAWLPEFVTVYQCSVDQPAEKVNMTGRREITKDHFYLFSQLNASSPV